ncbi:hypothetical protein GCM10028807_55670 [Spirosoma daeguense]
MSTESEEFDHSANTPKRQTNPSSEPEYTAEPDNQSEQRSEAASSGPERTNALEFLKPADGYVVTPVLIWLNVGIFILMALTGVNVLQPESQDLIRWGANYSPLTLDGEPWRLLSSCFLHIGILHLLFNMYALMQIGPVLEPLLGTRQFTIAYLTTGLSGSVVSLWWHDVVLGAGASGAIFGLYGVFLALLTTNWLDAETRRGLLRSILIFVGFNLMIGLQSGIDNAAHIGGLLAGLLFGYVFYWAVLRQGYLTNRNSVYLLIPPVVVLLMSAFVYTNTSNVAAEYDRMMNQFGQLEKQAMDALRLPSNTPAAEIANAIDKKGIVACCQAIDLLNKSDKLELPEKLRQRNLLLRQYATLRLNSFKVLKKSLTDTTHAYDQQIANYNRQIQTVLNKLKDK